MRWRRWVFPVVVVLVLSWVLVAPLWSGGFWEEMAESEACSPLHGQEWNEAKGECDRIEQTEMVTLAEVLAVPAAVLAGVVVVIGMAGWLARIGEDP